MTAGGPTPRVLRRQQPSHNSTKTIRDVIEGPFSDWLGDHDWEPWTAFLAALRAEPMTRAEMAIYQACTGRTLPPTTPHNEAWVIVGRRGRKSAIAAILGVYYAVYGKWPGAAGETVRVLVVAVSKDQAKIVRGYCQAILESRPGLARLIEATDSDSITLTNGIQIQCVANNYRSIRGRAVVLCVFEECAYYYSDQSANPDKELLRAVRPSMLTMPGALLLGISSPYARRGLLYEKFKAHFAKDGARVLIWKADTKTMNPMVDENVIAEAYEDDPVSAAAEYGAEFRSDIEQFITREAIDAVVLRGVRERAPVVGVRYVGFVDPSGGSSDSFTLAIGHLEKDVAVLDCLREVRPPFSPEGVVDEFAQLCKSYRITKVTGDKYAGEWPREQFKKRGIIYDPAAAPKSDLYRDLLPIVNSGKVSLLDNDRLVTQIVSLERRTARSGKDSIDHPPNARDDVANAAAGALVSLVAKKSGYVSDMSWVGDAAADWRAGQLQRFVRSGGLYR